MTCQECKELLIEQFGSDALSSDLTQHLAGCDECRRLWAELNEIKSGIGTNADSFPEKHEAELVSELVERQIRVGTIVTEARRGGWMRYAAVAAVVTLVSVSVVIWKMPGQTPEVVTGVDTVNVTGDTSATESEEELSTGTVATLLEDYATTGTFSASETLLGELTDEEAAYLEKQIKAGDLL